jgi:tRNA1(Val) A37 N6-methylase TrmN6
MVRNQLKTVSNGLSTASPENLNQFRIQREQMIVHKNGVVYTPEKLAHYLAQKTAHYMLTDPDFKEKKDISIIDNAVGDGILLEAMANALSRNKRIDTISLCGIDFDSKAIENSQKRLKHLGYNLTLINTNSLCPFNKELSQGWKQIFEQNKVIGGFDCLIENPPWGADFSDYKNKLNKEYFTVLQGQVDSYELFLQLALTVVKKGGYFAFIIPDSILNHGKVIIRKLLLDSTEIKFIARLGEKIFLNINRACSLIICKNSSPSNTNLVDCFRLTKKDRLSILHDALTFSEAELKSAHQVPQSRFTHNRDRQFDIDLRENEAQVLQKIRNTKSTLRDVLLSHRGVELGSSGLICRCPHCKAWAPMSESFSIKCSKCGSVFNPQIAEKTNIVLTTPASHSMPLITGSDLKRYVGAPSKWIIIDKKGINYKPKSYYENPKILIRKTGVGLTATLDYSGSYTNQVVYIFRTKSKFYPELEFFIALINSRAYYFYLAKSFGELEWRSHPYLTQSQILGLPMPNIFAESNKGTIEGIVSLLQPTLKDGQKPSDKIDLEIERLIGKLFSLTEKDYKIIFDAIDESDELLPILDLKNISMEDFKKATPLKG